MTVAFSLPGGIPVYSFALLLGIGGCLGLFWIAWQAPGERAATRVYSGLWMSAGAVLGSRAVYLGVHWEYYRLNPEQILELPLGGLSWPGAIGGALLVWLMLGRLGSEPLARLADSMLPLLASLSIAVWLGCWLDGCAYGPASQTWYAVPAPDEWGIIGLRWPLQFFGALLSLLSFGITDWLSNQGYLQRPGSGASLLALCLSLLTFWLTLQRADPGPFWNGMRLDAWAALGFLVLAALSGVMTLIYPALAHLFRRSREAASPLNQPPH